MTRGDERPAAYEALFRAHHPAVRAYVLRRLDDPGAADDVLAETFLIAWRRFETLGPDPLPWLFAVARRTLANQRRGERRRLALRERLHGDGETGGPPEPAAPDELDGSLAAALAALSPREREALLLVAWEGLDPARAARAAGCTTGAFRVRLHRARRHVARALEASAPTPAAPLTGRSR